MPWAPVLLKSCRTLSTWGPGSTQRPLVLGRHDDIWPSVQGVACQSPWGAAAAEGTCLPHADSTALSTHCVRAPGWLPPCWLRTASYFCRSARTAGDRELLSFRPEDPPPPPSTQTPDFSCVLQVVPLLSAWRGPHEPAPGSPDVSHWPMAPHSQVRVWWPRRLHVGGARRFAPQTLLSDA